mgnify:FL=1
MSTLYQLKPRFQNLLRPLVRSLAAAGVTANQITVLAMLLSLASGAAIAWLPAASWPLLALPLVLLLRMALNAVDGMLAREHGQKSPLGGILNEVGDVVSDAAIMLPFAWLVGIEAWLIFALVALAWLGEFVGVVAVAIGASRRYDGPLGKSDRAFAFGLLGLLLGLGVTPGTWSTVLLVLLNLLALATIWRRARAALRECAAAY